MSGLFQRIADAVYREYDRRIKRASLITEYGIAHRHDHQKVHADEDVAIVNLSPGALTEAAHTHPEATNEQGDAAVEHLEIEPLALDSDVAHLPAAAAEAEIEADIINAPPGAPISRD